MPGRDRHRPLKSIMPRRSGMTIKGLPEFQRKLKSWSSKVRKAAASGGFEWGERTMAVSKDGGEGYGGPIVPVDTGTLMSTGHVERPRIRGDKVTITLGYGGPTAKYSIPVHEMSEDSNWSRPKSGPGYLREPVRHMKRKVSEIVGPHVKAVLK